MAKMSKDEYLDSLMPMWGRLNRRPDGFIVLRVYYDAVICECGSTDCRGWKLTEPPADGDRVMSIVEPYRDDFTCWADVAREFAGYDVNEPLVAISEPDEVIIATYQTGGYEGDAWVVYRNGNKYFTVDGGHCSCHGLEGQWEPEEYELGVIINVLEIAGHSYGAQGEYRQLVLNELKSRLTSAQ
jgi:hypothetical protein